MHIHTSKHPATQKLPPLHSNPSHSLIHSSIPKFHIYAKRRQCLHKRDKTIEQMFNIIDIEWEIHQYSDYKMNDDLFDAFVSQIIYYEMNGMKNNQKKNEEKNKRK